MVYESLFLIGSNVLAFVLIMVILFAHTVDRRIRYSLIATIISLLLWQDTIFLADNASVDNLLLWNSAIFIWPTCAIAACFWFIQELHRDQSQKNERSRLTIPLIILTVLQLAPIALNSIFLSVTQSPDGLILDRAPGYYIYLVGLVGALGLLVAEIVIRRTRSARKSLERYAIHVVLVTVIVASLYGVVVNVVVPLLAGSQDYIGWGVLIVDIFAIGLTLSIAKGRLLDIRFYAIRTLVYVFSLGVLALIYVLAAYAFSQWLFSYGTSSVESWVNIALALLLAFIFQPVRHFFDKVTNRIFFRDSFDSEQFFSVLNQELSATNDIHTLIQRTAKFIASALKLERASFFIYREGQSYVQGGTDKRRKFSLQDARNLDVLTGDAAIILAHEIERKNQELYRLLVSHKISVLLPLRRDKKITGYLLLGEHRQGSYSHQDVNLLLTAGNELSIAIQNSLSIQAVRDLNAHLEQRIDAATKELRSSNAQLQKLDEAKDEFISIASHQLRTPLTSIKGYISMMMEGDVGKITPQQKHILEEAFISSDRMVRLIGDFLNVSRLQTGKFVIEKHPADLAQIVKHELESLTTNAASRGLTFRYTPPKKFPQLIMDENKMQQVVMNFCDNAIYYSKENSTIAVSLKIVKGFVEFKVKDSGIGVPKAQQKELFTKFFRANNARQQRPDGTGVGLFLAKKVIDAHHGELIFTSVENKGSTFGFRLPVERLRAGSDTE